MADIWCAHCTRAIEEAVDRNGRTFWRHKGSLDPFCGPSGNRATPEVRTGTDSSRPSSLAEVTAVDRDEAIADLLSLREELQDDQPEPVPAFDRLCIYSFDCPSCGEELLIDRLKQDIREEGEHRYLDMRVDKVFCNDEHGRAVDVAELKTDLAKWQRVCREKDNEIAKLQKQLLNSRSISSGVAEPEPPSEKRSLRDRLLGTRPKWDTSGFDRDDF